MKKILLYFGAIVAIAGIVIAADLTFSDAPQSTDNAMILSQRIATYLNSIKSGVTATISTPTLSSYFSETLSSTPVQIGATGSRTVYGYNIINPNSVPIYVHKYNAASGSVTVGTTTQNDAPWAVPANGVLFLAKNGLTHGTYATALTIAATTTATSAGTTAPTTNLIISIGYN